MNTEEESVQYTLDVGSKIDQALTDFLFPEFKDAGLTWRA